MKVNVETLETNRVKMDVEVDADEFKRAVDEAYRKLVKKADIPGFRRGKAPRFIFERFVGKGVLYEEAFESLFPGVYSKAVKDAGVEPVDQPDVDIQQMEEGKPLHFVARVTVKPEVILGDYRKVSVPLRKVEVTPEEVDAQIRFLQERHAQLVPAEGPVEEGHFVVIDFEGFLDGEPFPGGTAKDYVLEVGSGRFIPGFEDQVKGMAVGETKDIKIAFPSDYPAQTLAGKEVVFKTTIKEIKKKELPELTDDFAKSAASKETLQELRESIEKRLLEEKEHAARRAHQNEVIRQVVNTSSVEIPEVMINREADARFRRFLERLAELKITLDEYCQRTGQDVETVRKEMKEGAEWQVKADLVIEAIAKKEQITATSEEVDASVSEIATRYKQEPETIKSVLMSQDGLEGIKNAIITDKTIALLTRIAKENAQAEEQAVPPKEKQEEQEGQEK